MVCVGRLKGSNQVRVYRVIRQNGTPIMGTYRHMKNHGVIMTGEIRQMYRMPTRRSLVLHGGRVAGLRLALQAKTDG
jgi:hypothetical protein